MKKIFTLSLLFSLFTMASAQDVNVTDTKFTEDEFTTEYVLPIGLSADGSITWGYTPVGSLGYYNFNKPENPISWTEYSESDFFGIKVAGIPFDGKPLISNYMSSFFLDLETGDKTYIESPDSDLGIDAWDISSDGKYIACNLTDEAFLVIPMIGIRQDDGTYKLTYLEYDEYDAMGCIAQYTQTRYVSEDGKFVMGIQPDNRGMSGRYVMWTRQDDGSYKYSSPIDNTLYDFNSDKPGYAPEWDEYVTADPETQPDEFAAQKAAFVEAWDLFEYNYDKFTRNRSNIDMFATIKETRCNKICIPYEDYRTEESSGYYVPLIYDCDKAELIEYDFAESMTAVEQLPGGGNILDDGWNLIAVDDEGNQTIFTEWFMNTTGYDMAAIVSGGIPYFSEDGKNLLIAGTNNLNDATSTLFCFDRDIFAATATGIKVNVISEVGVNGSKVTLGTNMNGIVDVYALNGSKCGSYNINGSFDFATVLANGMYIIKVSVNGEKPSTMKLLVK